MEVSGPLHALATLPLEKSPLYPLDKRLVVKIKYLCTSKIGVRHEVFREMKV
jgi:hypothetical protein